MRKRPYISVKDLEVCSRLLSGQEEDFSGTIVIPVATDRGIEELRVHLEEISDKIGGKRKVWIYRGPVVLTTLALSTIGGREFWKDAGDAKKSRGPRGGDRDM